MLATASPSNGGLDAGFNLISAALPFGKLWYADAEAAVAYAGFYSRSNDIEIRFFDSHEKLIRRRTHTGDFVEP
jgi:hypothetical protein